MNIHILYTHYFDWEGGNVSIGGIQTYITNLCKIIIKMGHNAFVYQVANTDFKKTFDGIQVVGFRYLGKKDNFAKIGVFFREKLASRLTSENDVVIFATDTLITPFPRGIRTLGIQHGIGWDIPHEYTSQIGYFIYYGARAIKSYGVLRKYRYVDNLVCVDYNFVNWYRAITCGEQVDISVIPNFSRIPNKNRESNLEDECVRIIFARRFTKYRGTRLFTEAIKEVLSNSKLEVTIAGEGPDEEFLRKQFRDYKNVCIIQYKSEESLTIHSNHDIAVVPTLGSEGTSLSLLEAMASGCAVICTDVGGMTNVVIDGFNGIMIHPKKVYLVDALNRLIKDRVLRNELSSNAFLTCQKAFSYEKWESNWMNVLSSITNN